MHSLVLFNPLRCYHSGSVNKVVLRILRSSSITGASPSDYWVSYSGFSLGKSYPFAKMQSVYYAVQVTLGWFLKSMAVSFKSPAKKKSRNYWPIICPSVLFYIIIFDDGIRNLKALSEILYYIFFILFIFCLFLFFFLDDEHGYRSVWTRSSSSCW